MHARHPRDGQKEEDSRIYTRLANRRGLEERPSWLVPRKPRLRRTQSDHGARRPLRALTGQAPMPFPPGRFLAAAVDSIPSACQPVGAWRDSPIRVTSSTLGEGQPAVRDEARGGNGIIRMLVPVKQLAMPAMRKIAEYAVRRNNHPGVAIFTVLRTRGFLRDSHRPARQALAGGSRARAAEHRSALKGAQGRRSARRGRSEVEREVVLWGANVTKPRVASSRQGPPVKPTTAIFRSDAPPLSSTSLPPVCRQ
ncbi:hypothetical protein T310_0936 [Rasamsonia emersonii CBS 393.64]|uniref:Uncharacterized protein n=1 Tax=Rasamsonia emersonii (strain ATCC 16479 / CBS 393.64 / IMI 116815) TaxID=1408163 RepID=A0A0F4Z4Q1_RASE3|nr:hypothetical protein T310_0936 [Rasamsonia emersonii CBS 393.64]KKA25071.1 hypothetical protein T310_0936 [Rasamsonia emersonii CBS 393.64]